MAQSIKRPAKINHRICSLNQESALTTIEFVDKALAVASDRFTAAPGFQLLDSIIEQLNYLRAVLTGEEEDKSRLKKIIVGHYAIREFARSDLELAGVLIPVQYIASKMARGLRV
jgi:hypothetical protein